MSAGWFIAGAATAVVGTFLVAKAMREKIVEKGSIVATNSLVRFTQANGVNVSSLGIAPETIRQQLIRPAISDALKEVWI